MGVVISFPSKGKPDRRRRSWIAGAGGIFVLSLAAIAVLLAGQDLLRGSQADLLNQTAERASSPGPVSP